MNEAITVEQVLQHLTRPHVSRAQGMKFKVVVHDPGSLGPTPSVEIVSMQAGFDWDNGTMLLKPAQPLTKLTAEQVEAVMDSARKGHSWHAYQAQKRLRDRARDLEAERDFFRAACNEWLDKTEWVQSTTKPAELGKHRADVMRERIQALEAEVATLKQGGV